MKIKKLFKLYVELLRIRKIEVEIARRYTEQKMRCPIHLSIGQETIAVGICSALNIDDELVTAHRSHAHYLAKGGNLKKMIAELHGKETGCAMGLGGSMHLIDIPNNITAAVPIVGSTIPIGVGKAWANKIENKKSIVVIFFGDGATEEGVFFESLNFAALHQLRVIFVCENNNYSVYSNKKNRQYKKRSVVKIAESIGVKSIKFKYHDLEKIFSISSELVKKIRKKSQPYFLEINTYRFLEHCGPNNDDYLNYRPKHEIKYWLKNDPVKLIKNKLIRSDLRYIKLLQKVNQNIDNEINIAFKYSINSKFPKKKILSKYIYK
jgi:TPP-dependent pyruvate/acetoin dehydrogenase alpha subunit